MAPGADMRRQSTSHVVHKQPLPRGCHGWRPTMGKEVGIVSSSHESRSACMRVAHVTHAKVSTRCPKGMLPILGARWSWNLLRSGKHGWLGVSK
eukprot:4853851-Amphidinium_carterae.1